MQLTIPLKAMKAAGSGFSTRGGTLTSPLTLSRNPVDPLEAVSKGYIDVAVTSISATAIDQGVLSSERFPVFGGDTVKTAGAEKIALAATGVVASDYAKVNIDAKGRITAAFPLSGDDIPSLNWPKIVTNKPSTVEGYGIADAIKRTGDTMTGFLKLASPPTQTLHVVSKEYVDLAAGSSSKLNAGDLISHFGAPIPGFLRCNGGLLSKSTYPALFAMLGDKYGSSDALAGAGQPWRRQYAINTSQETDLTGWISEATLPAGFSQSQIFVTKSRVYLIAGYLNSSTGVASVYSAPINEDGSLGAWVTEPDFPVAIHSTQVVVVKNRVYVLGGTIAGSQSTAIYAAIINSDGTISAWLPYGNLPTTVYGAQAIITTTRLYVLGGTAPSGVGVMSASINTDGSLGAWIREESLPASFIWGQAIVTKNRVYLVGNGTVSMMTAVIGSEGYLGVWSVVANALSVPVRAAQVVTMNKRVYLMGGVDANGAFTTTVQTATVNTDGTLGSWNISPTVLPDGIGYAQSLVTSSRLYLLGHQGINRVMYASVTGGKNDYSMYYDGTVTVVSPTTFTLPDFTSKEKDGLKYYIKY